MEAIFKQAKEEQEKSDQAFEEEQQAEGIVNDEKASTGSVVDPIRKGRSRKVSKLPLTRVNNKITPGSTVRVISGTFAEFTGSLKKLDRKTGKVCCFHRGISQ